MERVETLQEFTLRTEWRAKDSLRIADGRFTANGNLGTKVNPDGTLTNPDNPEGDWYKEKYCGNTLVFLLDEETKARLGEIQDKLYAAAGHMLAEPLDKLTFHMTLHDLKSGVPSAELVEQMAASEKVARPLLRAIKTDGVAKIRMKASYLFNMGNTSMVLGLVPVDEENCERLMILYNLFQRDESIRLPYRLTPHVTMGYYRTGSFEESSLDGLKRVIDEVNREISLVRPIEVELSTEQLVYQTFTDMNHYYTVE